MSIAVMSGSVMSGAVSSTKPMTYINPVWLTMVPGSGECQICKTPEGKTHTYYLNIRYNGDDKFGFLVCGKEECNTSIKHYLDTLYSNIYNTKTWKRILNIYANNLFIKVERSNGDIEYDWTLDNDWDHDSNKIPLRTSFMYAILCQHKNNDARDAHDARDARRICSRLPNEIWEYIYTISLEKYRENINLTLNQYNKIKNSMEPCIRVKKGGIYKRVSIDLI